MASIISFLPTVQANQNTHFVLFLVRSGSAICAEIGPTEKDLYGGVGELRISTLILTSKIGMNCQKVTLKPLKDSKIKKFFGVHFLEKMAL